MRKTRRLLLLALILAAAGVAIVYRDQRARMDRDAPAKPEALAQNLQSVSKDWVYYKGDGDRPVLEVRAKEMEQVAGTTAVIRLKGVDLRLYKKTGKAYDHVESASAEFDQAASSLFAEGEVTITLAVPEEDPAQPKPAGAENTNPEHLLKIITSGVHFASSTGKAETEKPARFEFDLGSGSAVGATYDPQARDLHLLHDVKLDWRGRDKTRPPMHVEAAQLVYREAESKVHLIDRSHFERQTLKMDGGNAVISLVDGAIRNVEAADAHGTDVQPKRNLTFAAKLLKLDLTPRSEIEKVLGEGASRIDVRTPTGTTALTSERVLMNFATGPEAAGGSSVLRDALAQGRGELHSRPSTPGGTERIVHSDSIFAKMRPGGEELELVETRSPGVLDLLPLPGPGAPQPKRHLEATRMWLDYAPGNAMETFRAIDARTRTDRAAEPNKPAPPPSVTSSKELIAHFEPKSGVMTTLEQTTEFRYEEGPQRATAQRATLDQMTQRIVLTGNARSWDTSGQVTAKTITMDQTAGRMIAEGDVVSTREPETKPADATAASNKDSSKDATAGPLLNPGEVLHGKAGRMTISDRNTVIVHEGATLQDGKPQGRAVVWQGANRIEATKVTINRMARTLAADGQVTSLLVDGSANKDSNKDAAAKPATDAPDKSVITTVRAAALNYSDETKLAHYSGGVRLARPGLDVRSTELNAFMAQQGSGLERMVADGAVAISQTRPGGWRKGSSEHAEYFTAGEKVILSGGSPVMTDSVKGSTKGTKLTYTGADDSLLVEGAVEKPSTSRILRR